MIMPHHKCHKIKAYKIKTGNDKGKFIGMWQKPHETDWTYCLVFWPKIRKESALADCRHYLDTMEKK